MPRKSRVRPPRIPKSREPIPSIDEVLAWFDSDAEEEIEKVDTPVLSDEEKRKINTDNIPLMRHISETVFVGFELETRDKELRVNVTSSELRENLAEALKIAEGDVENQTVQYLFDRLGKIRRYAQWNDDRDPELNSLITFLDSVKLYTDESAAARLHSGVATYADLPLVFMQRTKVIWRDGEHICGGEVSRIAFRQTFFGEYVEVTIAGLVAQNGGVSKAEYGVNVGKFDGATAISGLVVHPASTAELAALTAQGERFRKYFQVGFMDYRGPLVIPAWTGDRTPSANGRAIADSQTIVQVDNDTHRQMNDRFRFDRRENATSPTINDCDLWCCYYRLPIFSMALKRWGWGYVDCMHDIVWRDTALANLVMDEHRKTMIKALVEHHHGGFSDFIEGKSGGLVFLLSGQPGTGKTLTAEAVADTLRRPLYTIGVGELGTSPDALEQALRRVLDLASTWNAVLLLDEADIFMERRADNDIERNAMVSIFLRLLEYHTGVLFLTTNRVSTFDPAFYSRISLALQFPPLDQDSRTKVWINICRQAGIDMSGLDMAALAAYPINGRQIKNAIRVAYTLAKAQDREVEQKDLVDVIDASESFNLGRDRGLRAQY